MKVRVNVSSVSGGQQFNTSSIGELTIGEDEFSVHYYSEGDECRLTVRGGEVTQQRRGNLGFEIRFREGEDTLCILREGEREFPVPLHTFALGISLSDDGCSVALRYELGDIATELVFTAERIGKQLRS